ncbi:MAG: endonuclease domain-containing protein [Dehalococcoidia bacterium]
MERQRRTRNNVRAARQLRTTLTEAEELVWAVLQDRGYRGLKFRRQHPVGRFVLDFYCAELKLALEIDGPIHEDPAHLAQDGERQRILEEESGLRFVRITNQQVATNLIEVLDSAFKGLPPSPGSPGEGAGG